MVYWYCFRVHHSWGFIIFCGWGRLQLLPLYSPLWWCIPIENYFFNGNRELLENRLKNAGKTSLFFIKGLLILKKTMMRVWRPNIWCNIFNLNVTSYGTLIFWKINEDSWWDGQPKATLKNRVIYILSCNHTSQQKNLRL